MSTLIQDDFHVIAPLHNPEALKDGNYLEIDNEFKTHFLEQYGGSHQNAEAATHIKFRGYPDGDGEIRDGAPINWGLGIDKAGVKLSSLVYELENNPEKVYPILQSEFPQLTDEQCEAGLRTVFLLLSSLEAREAQWSTQLRLPETKANDLRISENNE